jgi:hypothetical protein
VCGLLLETQSQGPRSEESISESNICLTHLSDQRRGSCVQYGRDGHRSAHCSHSVLVGALPVTVVVDCSVVVTVFVVVVVVVQVCMVDEAGFVVVFNVEEAFLVLVVMELPAALHCPPTTPAAQGLH